jgi:hypothetical protein
VPEDRGPGERSAVARIRAAEQVPDEQPEQYDSHGGDERTLADHAQDRATIYDEEDHRAEKQYHPTHPVRTVRNRAAPG